MRRPIEFRRTGRPTLQRLRGQILDIGDISMSIDIAGRRERACQKRKQDRAAPHLFGRERGRQGHLTALLSAAMGLLIFDLMIDNLFQLRPREIPDEPPAVDK
jgi:hypothetical protein